MTAPRSVFNRLRAKAKTGILLEGGGIVAALLVAFVAASYAADRTLRLEVGFRLVLLLLLVVAAGYLLYRRILGPLAVDLDDEEMALAVERADPGARQALISAVQFEAALSGGGRYVESPELMRVVIRDVHERMRGFASDRALDGRRVARFGAMLAGSVLAIGGWAALDAEEFGLWARRNLALSAVEWPRDTLLHFVGESGEVRLPEGDDLTLRVRADGVVPEQVFLRYRFAGGERGSEPMTLTGEREFTFTLSAVLEDVDVWAEGGDGETGEMAIRLVPRPRIRDLRVTLVYPEYMDKEPATLPETRGDIRVPKGGRMRIAATSSKRLASASWTFGQDAKGPLVVAPSGTDIAGEFAPPETGLWTLHVVDEDRLDAARPPKLFLRLVDDQVPSVEFETLGIGSMITPVALIPGRLTVRDDYGLVELAGELRISRSVDPEADPEKEPGEEPRWEAAEVAGLDAFAPEVTDYAADTMLDLEPLAADEDAEPEANDLRPGRFLSVRFRARDNFGPGEPHVGSSDVLTFRVVTREKLMEDLGRRQAEQRRELLQILEDEKAGRNELAEILSPAADDPKAARAGMRVLTLARKQRALGRRVDGVAERYDQILSELRNNRILEPNQVLQIRSEIPQPLQRLAEEEFPSSAELVTEFASSGEQDLREAAVASYETIINEIEQVLDHMEEMESLATLLESLRQVIKVQDAAIEGARKRRDQEARSLFGPDPGKGESGEDDRKDRDEPETGDEKNRKSQGDKDSRRDGRRREDKR